MQNTFLKNYYNVVRKTQANMKINKGPHQKENLKGQ